MFDRGLRQTEGKERKMTIVGERKLIRLRTQGGSRSALLPKAWLDHLGITDEVEATCTESAIVLGVPGTPASIEDDPEFAVFLRLLTKDSLARLDQLGDMADLMEGDGELVADVSVE